MEDIFEQQLTCTVCLDLYEDPVILPCLHTFCRCCLQRLVENGVRNRRLPILRVRTARFNCPECRKLVVLGQGGVNDLPKNFQIASIVATFRVNRRGDSRDGPDAPTHHFSRQSCHICRHNFAVKLCLSCVAAYCTSCLQASHPDEAAWLETQAGAESSKTEDRNTPNGGGFRQRLRNITSRWIRTDSQSFGEGHSVMREGSHSSPDAVSSELPEADQHSAAVGDDDDSPGIEGRPRKRHPLLNLDIVCGHHKGEHMIAFCFQCLTLACSVSIARHEGHLVLQLVDAILIVKDEITKGANYLRDTSSELKVSYFKFKTITDKLKKDCELITENIRLECDKLRHLITEREELLVRQVTRVSNQDFLANQQLVNLCETKAFKMEELAMEMQLALKPIDTIAFIQRGLSMKRRIPNLERLYPIPKRVPFKRLTYYPITDKGPLHDLDVIVEEFDIDTRGLWFFAADSEDGPIRKTERLSSRKSPRTANFDTLTEFLNPAVGQIRGGKRPPADGRRGEGQPQNLRYAYQQVSPNQRQQTYPPVPGANAYYDVIQRQNVSSDDAHIRVVNVPDSITAPERSRYDHDFSFYDLAALRHLPDDRDRGRGRPQRVRVVEFYDEPVPMSADGTTQHSETEPTPDRSRGGEGNSSAPSPSPNAGSYYQDTQEQEPSATPTGSGAHPEAELEAPGERDSFSQNRGEGAPSPSPTPSLENEFDEEDDDDLLPDLSSYSSPDENYGSRGEQVRMYDTVFTLDDDDENQTPETADESREPRETTNSSDIGIHDTERIFLAIAEDPSPTPGCRWISFSEPNSPTAFSIDTDRQFRGIADVVHDPNRIPSSFSDTGPRSPDTATANTPPSDASNADSQPQEADQQRENQAWSGATARETPSPPVFQFEWDTAHVYLTYIGHNTAKRVWKEHHCHSLFDGDTPPEEIPFSPTSHPREDRMRQARCSLCEDSADLAEFCASPRRQAGFRRMSKDRRETMSPLWLGRYRGTSCGVLGNVGFTRGVYCFEVECQFPTEPRTRDWIFAFGVSNGHGNRYEPLTNDESAWCMEVSGVGYRFVRHGSRVKSVRDGDVIVTSTTSPSREGAAAAGDTQSTFSLGLVLDLDHRSLTFYRCDTRSRLFTFSPVQTRPRVRLYPAFSFGRDELIMEFKSGLSVPDYLTGPSHQTQQQDQSNQPGNGTQSVP